MDGYKYIEGSRTLLECAAFCWENPNCVAFDHWPSNRRPQCFHYSDMSKVVDANELHVNCVYTYRAYIKCLGIQNHNVTWNCFIKPFQTVFCFSHCTLTNPNQTLYLQHELWHSSNKIVLTFTSLFLRAALVLAHWQSLILKIRKNKSFSYIRYYLEILAQTLTNDNLNHKYTPMDP